LSVFYIIPFISTYTAVIAAALPLMSPQSRENPASFQGPF